MIALNSDSPTLNPENSPESLELDSMIDILAHRSMPTIQPEVDETSLSEHQSSTIDLDEHSFNQDRLELGLAPEIEDDLSLDDIEIDESGESDYDLDEDELAATLLDQNVEMIPYGPTDSSPGSEEKVQVLISRYAQGHPLWHKDDSSRLEGGNLEEEGRMPRRAPRKEAVISEEEKLLLWSSRYQKAKEVEAAQEQLPARPSRQTNSSKLQSKPDAAQAIDSTKEELIAVAQPVQDPSRSRSNREPISGTLGDTFVYNPSNQLEPAVKANRPSFAPPRKAAQATSNKPGEKVFGSQPPTVDLRRQYEMLVKGVACGGIAQTDLTAFIQSNGQKLAAIGIDA